MKFIDIQNSMHYFHTYLEMNSLLKNKVNKYKFSKYSNNTEVKTYKRCKV